MFWGVLNFVGETVGVVKPKKSRNRFFHPLRLLISCAR